MHFIAWNMLKTLNSARRLWQIFSFNDFLLILKWLCFGGIFIFSGGKLTMNPSSRWINVTNIGRMFLHTTMSCWRDLQRVVSWQQLPCHALWNLRLVACHGSFMTIQFTSVCREWCFYTGSKFVSRHNT